MKIILSAIIAIAISQGIVAQTVVNNHTKYPIHLIVLDPGHFHAALVQKKMYKNVSPEVRVYSPGGAELDAYTALVDKYNTRPESPTKWHEKIYKGNDFLEKMIGEKAGNVVIIAGNNQKKDHYIQSSITAGINVLADKPMLIDREKFEDLVKTFELASSKKTILFDIMTERYDIMNVLQKELLLSSKVFGTLKKGTAENPSIIEENKHYYLKTVSGAPLIRPAWFYDIHQQGDGLADVITHLLDNTEWKCFSERKIDYVKDIQVIKARKWATPITPAQFYQSTHLSSYPDYLQQAVKDTVLQVEQNGEISYRICDVYASAHTEWLVEAKPGAGDSHNSILKGTKSNLIIQQDEQTNFKPVLYIEPVEKDNQSYANEVSAFFAGPIAKKFPGVTVEQSPRGWKVSIPEKYNIGHEQQFALVAGQFMEYLKAGKLPQKEVDFMLAKYFTVAEALKMAE